MSGPRFRSPGGVLLSIGCAAVIGATSMLTAGFVFGGKRLIADVALLAGEGWIMGGTTEPDPTQAYISEVEQLYLNSQVPGVSFTGLNTPEEACPVICFPAPADDPSSWSTMNLGQSINTGVGILDQQIQQALAANPSADLGVLGYSQSADIATQEMTNLIASGQTDPNLHVVLLGDPNSPIGGILDRFQFPDGVQAFSLQPAPQHLPFLDVSLSMAPTPTTPFPTDIYTGEYDGYANWPEDPTNILADINAGIGIDTVHPYYPDPTPGVNLDTNNIIDLGTIGNTNFYDIPAPLPMLAFMYDGGPAGRFFYDFFNPFLSLINNWGYGNPGDPGAGIPVNGIDPIGAAGPWQVDATGQLVPSGVAGLLPQMDPLQVLAGEEYAAVQTIVGPINALLQDAGQSPLPQSFVDSLLSGYDATNQLDASLLTDWSALTASIPSLGPDAIFSGAPLISGQPLVDLAGFGFDIFNFFGA
ncbi:MAG: PE-PPE domain-containing protein [Mycobacterium sp.]|nr:PE-PPE domain-containing protein [Mycobacterium sp.]